MSEPWAGLVTEVRADKDDGVAVSADELNALIQNATLRRYQACEVAVLLLAPEPIQALGAMLIASSRLLYFLFF